MEATYKFTIGQKVKCKDEFGYWMYGKIIDKVSNAVAIQFEKGEIVWIVDYDYSEIFLNK